MRGGVDAQRETEEEDAPRQGTLYRKRDHSPFVVMGQEKEKGEKPRNRSRS